MTIQITFNTEGEVSTRVAPCAPRKDDVLKYLGVTNLGPMDTISEERVGGEDVVTVQIAQKQPWTWMRYVFIS